MPIQPPRPEPGHPQRTTVPCDLCGFVCYADPCAARREAAERVARYAIANGAASLIVPEMAARVTR